LLRRPKWLQLGGKRTKTAPMIDAASSCASPTRRLLRHAPQGPFTGDAFQRMHALVSKCDPGAHNEIFYGIGHENPVWRRLARDARSKVHSKTTEVVSTPLAFTGVQTDTYIEAETR
jgi:hypothetical protein